MITGQLLGRCGRAQVKADACMPSESALVLPSKHFLLGSGQHKQPQHLNFQVPPQQKLGKQGTRPLPRLLPSIAGMVEEVLPRTSELSDPAVANVDHVVLVFSAAAPPWQPVQVGMHLGQSQWATHLCMLVAAHRSSPAPLLFASTAALPGSQAGQLQCSVQHSTFSSLLP